jgi:hypothetical protein
MRLDHPIFRGPLQPTIELHEVATPGEYPLWYEGRGLPATIPVWQVQVGALGKEIDYGLVSDPYGFEDSPDCEWISSGINSKGPSCLALGRQGNWFHWGFGGDPRQMTASARQVFLNTVVWMRAFDGRSVLLDRPPDRAPRAREWLLTNLSLYENATSHSASVDARMVTYFHDSIPAALFAACGDDPVRMFAWCSARLEYVRAVRSKPRIGYQDYEFDPMLERLGVSNRRLEFFDTLVKFMRERGAGDPSVADLCGYLPADAPRDADSLAAWVEQRRDRLFFSDTYDYRWFVAPAGVPPRATTAVPSPRSPATRESEAVHH